MDKCRSWLWIGEERICFWSRWKRLYIMDKYDDLSFLLCIHLYHDLSFSLSIHNHDLSFFLSIHKHDCSFFPMYPLSWFILSPMYPLSWFIPFLIYRIILRRINHDCGYIGKNEQSCLWIDRKKDKSWLWVIENLREYDKSWLWINIHYRKRGPNTF
jgi:hypothetical protein